PGAHHAFVAAAVEAARYYPGQAPDVIALFQRIRGDEMLRRFLAPKILASLYVLGDPAALPLYEELLIAGHTHPDAGRCGVTAAPSRPIVMGTSMSAVPWKMSVGQWIRGIAPMLSRRSRTRKRGKMR